jgi:hypothetical protein
MRDSQCGSGSAINSRDAIRCLPLWKALAGPLHAIVKAARAEPYSLALPGLVAPL